MKKIIIVLSAIIGLVMAGCDNPAGDQTNPNNPNNTLTPTSADFDISGLMAIADGNPKAVSITPKTGKSTGTITIYYTGIEGTNYPQSTTPPSAPGRYAVTFNVAAAEGFYAINDLGAGTLVINQQSPDAVDPVASDFDVSGLTAIADGNPKAVSITPQTGNSTGTITTYYTGIEGTNYPQSTTPPSAIGTYAVTFDVAAALGFNAVTGLSAGTLIISDTGLQLEPKMLVIDFENAAWIGNAYTERPVRFGGYSWTVSGVVNPDANDRFKGTQSVRLRGNSGDNCRVELTDYLENGIDSISFDYASYSTHSGGTIVLSYQIEDSSTWTEVGRVTAPAWNVGTGMLNTSYNLNIEESVRFKIAREGGLVSGTSVNIDNIVVAYTAEATSGKEPGDIAFSSGDLSIHFLELGNKYTGDCVYINYGEMDIIIDAGSKQASSTTIKAYIDNYIQDNKLEYVIATHAHEDHISGFNGTNGILASYEIGTIIDFPKTNSTTATYNNYRTARTAAIARGAVHYNALQCFRNQDGAQREYDLGDGVKLEILYNYYYENESNSENDYSVCVRIVQDGKRYLFTGDMEKAGEDRLVDYYAANFGGLGRHVLYKGGHHGSQTSANEKLMAAISPEYVCVCTCAGSAEYGANPQNVFPSQVFINRIAPYTDKVYVTTFVPDYANNVVLSMNGNIVFFVADGEVGISCSNNNLKLKETEWFINNRTMPAAWR